MEYQISVKLDEEQNQAIDRLAERHDCSRAEAVRKAVQFAANSDNSAPQVETKIDAIGETSVEILRLLQQHSQQSADAIKNTRLWAQQCMFFGKALALKFEVREQALAMMKEQLKKEEEKQNGGAK